MKPAKALPLRPLARCLRVAAVALLLLVLTGCLGVWSVRWNLPPTQPLTHDHP